MPRLLSQKTKEWFIEHQKNIPDLEYEFELNPDEAERFFTDFLPVPDDFVRAEFDQMFTHGIDVKYTIKFYKTDKHDEVLDQIIERQKKQGQQYGTEIAVD